MVRWYHRVVHWFRYGIHHFLTHGVHLQGQLRNVRFLSRRFQKHHFLHIHPYLQVRLSLCHRCRIFQRGLPVLFFRRDYHCSDQRFLLSRHNHRLGPRFLRSHHRGCRFFVNRQGYGRNRLRSYR